MAIVVPAIFRDSFLQKLNLNLKLRGLATDSTGFVGDVINCGDTVHFPSFVRNATAAAVVQGTALVPAVVDMSDCSASIYQIAASKRIYDKDAVQVRGNVIEAVITELADAMAKKMDADLGAAILADATLLSPTAGATAITNAEIQTALDLFGDQQDIDTFAGIVINSRLRSSFMGMDAFVKSETTYRTMGNGLTVNGCIGDYYGIPVFVSDNGTWDSTASECITFILKKDALQYVLQRSVAFEEQRPSGLLASDLIVSSLYACKLVEAAGAVVVRKTTT